MARNSILICFFVFIFFETTYGQFRENFVKGTALIAENRFQEALKIWLELDKDNPYNFNIAYKIGHCYLSLSDYEKGIKYLERAASNVTNKYSDFNVNEKQAPLEASFLLAKGYHLAHRFDDAIAQYKSHKTLVGFDTILVNETERNMRMSQLAKAMISNPEDFRIENLGSEINSKYEDFSPVASLDETEIFFTSRRLRSDSSNKDHINQFAGSEYDGGYFEDVYLSKSHNGKWSRPEILPFSTPDNHQAAISISPDGQTLYVYKNEGGDGNIYSSSLVQDGWEDLVKLPSNVNSKERETHITVSADGNSMYFASDRKGGIGGKDIYRCVKLPTGEWSLPYNVGPPLNTPYDEDAPYLHPDGVTMYFSSNGHQTMGGYDIFSSQQDENRKWSDPINIGYPLNTVEDDVFFVTTADGKRAYFSSKREGGFGGKDLYMAILPNKTSKDVTVLKGFLSLATGGKLPENTVIEVINLANNNLSIATPRARDGGFIIVAHPCNTYSLNYKVNDRLIYMEEIEVPCGSSYQELSKELFLNNVIVEEPEILNVLDTTNKEDVAENISGVDSTKINSDSSNNPNTSSSNNSSGINVTKGSNTNKVVDKPFVKKAETSKNEKIAFENVLFDFAKENVKKEYKPMLEKLGELLKQDKFSKVSVVGHTDWIGDPNYNVELSRRRAFQVRNYLIKKGVKDSQIIILWHGPNQPIASNKTALGRAQNRRVEIMINSPNKK